MGATGAQNTLQTEQMQAYQQAQQMTEQMYQSQQAIYAPMEKQFQSIFNAGPDQQGFSTAETDTLDAQAVQGTAANYSAAAKAVGDQTAAEGGGNEYEPSGAADEMKQEVANSAAGQESQQETQIQEANYQQGYAQWGAAAGGLESIAAGDNPLGYESAETGAGSAAGTTASQIASEDNSWINAAIGAAGTIGGAVVGENPGGIFGG